MLQILITKKQIPRNQTTVWFVPPRTLALKKLCRDETWWQTLGSSWLHKLSVCTNSFADFAKMAHLLKNIKVWIQYYAALKGKRTSQQREKNNEIMYTNQGQGRIQNEKLTISPITWLSLCSVRLTPSIPNTTKTMAPVSTKGRTAGWPHVPPLHGLKPDVLDVLFTVGGGGSSEIEQEEKLFTAFVV